MRKLGPGTITPLMTDGTEIEAAHFQVILNEKDILIIKCCFSFHGEIMKAQYTEIH